MATKKTSAKKTAPKQHPPREAEEATQQPLKGSDRTPAPKKASASEVKKAMSSAVAIKDA